jgi:hypothetical protein
MSDDLEFDRMLEDELSALPLDEGTVAEVTPWRQAIHRIVLGLALTTCTLNFWNLDRILPAAGYLLLVLGFRALRRETPWLRLGWLLSIVLAAAQWAVLVYSGTIYSATLTLPGWAESAGTVFSAALPNVQMFALWRGIRAVRRRAGQADSAGAAGAMVVWRLVITALALWNASGWWLLPLLVSYLLVLRSLSKVASLLDGVGYDLHAAPVLATDKCLWLGWVLSLVVCIVLGATLLGRYPMTWTPVADNEQTGLEEIRDNLLSLGMPAEVVNDLSPEDLADCAGALSVTGKISQQPFNTGRQVTTQVGSTTITDTVYDVKEMVFRNLAVELPDGRWKIIHHFTWQTDPKVRGTECIRLMTAGGHSEGWDDVSAVTGRLLYDWQGVTYTGDYYSLQSETNTAQSWFFGASTSTDPIALFSLPRKGTNCRGYLAYDIRAYDEDTHWIVSAWCNYTHQTSWLNYPLKTAKEFEYNSWGSDWRFARVQEALQFDPWVEADESWPIKGEILYEET